jgi:glycosyltransferase involved in cell wall biosynthesis
VAVRVLVYPRDLELGGSSINAIDLAAAMRRRGHETMVLAQPGPLAARVEASGVPLITVPIPPNPRPSPQAVRAIADAVRRHRIDIVHTYEFWTCVEAFFGAGVRHGVPVLGTVMTMGLAPYLPHSVPLTLGYRDLLDEARGRHPAPVHLLEPPVDLTLDRPGTDTESFVRNWALDTTMPTVVIVSRAAVAMKQEGIERAMDAIERLTAPVQLVVVGGGSAAQTLAERACATNDRLGRRAVVLTGPLDDPRPAYEVADVVVGMGGSVLRGMAFGKPIVVVGEEGFSLPVTPETLSTFDRTGFYGIGTGRPDPAEDPLVGQLDELLVDSERRRSLGDFGHLLVHERFDLEKAAESLERIYRQTLEGQPRAYRRGTDALMTTGRVLRHKAAGRGLAAGLVRRAA